MILPLVDARRHPVDNVKAWTERQDCPHDWFQIVAVAAAADAESTVERLLRAGDKLVRCRADERAHSRAAIGARHADADILLFTEHHCIPDPSCVGAVVRFFDAAPEIAAGRIELQQREGSRHWHLDERWFTTMNLGWTMAGRCPRLGLAVTAIRKAAYLALGGYDSRFSLFAEDVLSAHAHEAGYAVASIPGTVVGHIMPTTMRGHQGNIARFTRGECAYRASHDPQFCERYFGHEPVWANRFGLGAGINRAAIVAIARIMVRELASARDKRASRRAWTLIREIAPRLPDAMLGARWRVPVARIKTRWSEWRAIHPARDPDSQYVHFERSWQRMRHQIRLGAALAHCRLPASIAPTPDYWPVGSIEEAARIGFNGLESHAGQTFRWAEPLAMIRFKRPPGRTRVTIATGGLRGLDCSYVRAVCWNGRPVAHRATPAGDVSVEIDVPSGAQPWLTIVTDPLQAPADRRRLGMPVFAMTFDPAP